MVLPALSYRLDRHNWMAKYSMPNQREELTFDLLVQADPSTLYVKVVKERILVSNASQLQQNASDN
jgi:hypothetical protein